jgi:hypothetical protein
LYDEVVRVAGQNTGPGKPLNDGAGGEGDNDYRINNSCQEVKTAPIETKSKCDGSIDMQTEEHQMKPETSQ